MSIADRLKNGNLNFIEIGAIQAALLWVDSLATTDDIDEFKAEYGTLFYENIKSMVKEIEY